jgi:hypothetical protein
MFTTFFVYLKFQVSYWVGKRNFDRPFPVLFIFFYSHISPSNNDKHMTNKFKACASYQYFCYERTGCPNMKLATLIYLYTYVNKTVFKIDFDLAG